MTPNQPFLCRSNCHSGWIMESQCVTHPEPIQFAYCLLFSENKEHNWSFMGNLINFLWSSGLKFTYFMYIYRKNSLNTFDYSWVEPSSATPILMKCVHVHIGSSKCLFLRSNWCQNSSRKRRLSAHVFATSCDRGLTFIMATSSCRAV